MQIDHMYHLHLDESELKNVLADRLEVLSNDHEPKSPEFNKLQRLACAVRDEHTRVESDGCGGVSLTLDGVVYEEDVDLG